MHDRLTKPTEIDRMVQRVLAVGAAWRTIGTAVADEAVHHPNPRVTVLGDADESNIRAIPGSVNYCWPPLGEERSASAS